MSGQWRPGMGILKKIICLYCDRPLIVNPRTASSQYTCGDEACQRKRKNDWQREKRKADAAYREQNARCNREWRKKPENKDYYKNRRKLKAEASKEPAQEPNAKSELISADLHVASGLYRITLEPVNGIGPEDGGDGCFEQRIRIRSRNKRSEYLKKRRKSSCKRAGPDGLL